MGGGLISTLDDLARKIRRLLDGLADHEGGKLDLVLVHQVENTRLARIDTVLEKYVCRQVGRPLLEPFSNPSRSDWG
jgi:hypothetical protein